MKSIVKFVMTLFVWLAIFPDAYAQDSLFADPVHIAYRYNSRPVDIFAADLDSDGDIDLVVANMGAGLNNISVIFNNGDGTFQTPVDYGHVNGPNSIFAADLDGDSDYDLAVGNSLYDSISVFTNDGNGTFQPASKLGAGQASGPGSIFAADLDGDNDNDLIAASVFYNSVMVYINDGDGTFQPVVYYAGLYSPQVVYATDLDGDSDNDLAVTSPAADAISILKNNGNGTFLPAVHYAVGDYPTSVLAIDLDGDGGTDLAATNQFSGTFSILFNEGDSTFQAAVNYHGGSWPSSIIAADFDMDGANDLVGINPAFGRPNIPILLNNGDRTFQDSIFYTAGDAPSAVCAADLDGDSDIDLAVANNGGENVSIILNRTIPTGTDNYLGIYLPQNFHLYQNYPNPFNPATTIRFSMPENEYVELKVYNILGKQVANLVSTKLNQGNHSYIFDAKNLASGIYYYQLIAGDYREIKKMILLK
jgi:hypothetical protein